MKDVTVTLKVHLHPRTARNGIDGLHGNALKVKVTAPPVEGKANKAMKKLLAEQLGISPSQIEIIAGEHSREKVLRISGISKEEMEKALSITIPPR